MSSRRKDGNHLLTRREILKGMALTPVALRAAPLFAGSLLQGPPNLASIRQAGLPIADLRLTPHYPAKSPLADILALVTPGSDGYITEKYADKIGSALKKWSDALKAAPAGLTALAESLDDSIEASTLVSAKEIVLRSDYGIHSVRRQFTPDLVRGRDRFIESMRSWLAAPLQIETAEFEIFAIQQIAGDPLAVRTEIRYDLVSTRSGARKEERVGSWRTEWVCDRSRRLESPQVESGRGNCRDGEGSRICRCHGTGPGQNRFLQPAIAPRRRLLAHRARRRYRHGRLLQQRCRGGRLRQ